MDPSRPRIVRSILLTGIAISTVIAIAAANWADLLGTPRLFLLLLNATFWIAWTAIAPAVLWLSGRVPILPGRRVRAVVVHVLASGAFAGVHITIVTVAFLFLRVWLIGTPLADAWRDTPMPTRMQLEWEITMYWALVGLAHAVSFRMEAQERALREAQLESQLAHAQLQALQRQLQPHFLFNTLHSISALVYRSPREAERMIERLGGLLRMTLASGDALVVSLDRELEHLGHYLEIERTNMGSRLQVTVDAPPDTLGAAVPGLVLQPLVENAVRHGLAPRARGGRVQIVARRNGDRLVIRIIDDGLGLRPGKGRKGTGIGIENTRHRLQQFYGGDHRFEIESAAEGGVGVTIDVPFRTAPLAESPKELAWTR